MSYRLTAREHADYDRDGFLVREKVFTADEVESLRAAVERASLRALDRSHGGKTYFLDNKRFVDAEHMTVQFEHSPESETIRVIEPVHELDQRLDELLDDARISDPMRDIIGSEDLALWTNKLNLKRPREGSGFGWHQDSPYWVHDSDHVDLLPNVMVSLDDARLDNGCFQVIRGSHTKGCLPGTDNGTQLGGFFTDPSCFDEKDAVPMEVDAGGLIFFSAHSIHGSGPNTSSSPRRALVLTYQPGGYPALKSGEFRPIRQVS